MAPLKRLGRVRGSKYDPLREHLRASRVNRVPMSFKQIEKILDTTLPRSAFRYQAWWSNSLGTHIQAFAWIDAGYKTAELNLAAHTVVFQRG